MLSLEWAPVAGALVGFVVGLTGVGGGALMAPILLIGFGLDLSSVVATDLLFATATKLVTTRIHYRNRFIDWPVTKQLWLGSLPSTLIIVCLARSNKLFSSPEWIIYLIGILILFSAISIIFSDHSEPVQSAERMQKSSNFLKMQPILTTFAGGMIGALVTLTSVGAGALGAGILRALYPMRMHTRRLVATDTIHAIPVSLFGGLSYLTLGLTDLDVLGLLLLGSIPCAMLGAKVSVLAPARVIRFALGIILLFTGLKLLIF